MKLFIVFIVFSLFPIFCFAVDPEELLKEPELEYRARELSKDIRCLVCRNENIDSSNADLAKDLRLLVRERLLVGDTDQEIKNFLVSRYGQYILLRPSKNGSSLILWLIGPLILFFGGFLSINYIRKSSKSNFFEKNKINFSEEERKKINKFLDN